MGGWRLIVADAGLLCHGKEPGDALSRRCWAIRAGNRSGLATLCCLQAGGARSRGFGLPSRTDH